MPPLMPAAASRHYEICLLRFYTRMPQPPLRDTPPATLMRHYLRYAIAVARHDVSITITSRLSEQFRFTGLLAIVCR